MGVGCWVLVAVGSLVFVRCARLVVRCCVLVGLFVVGDV